MKSRDKAIVVASGALSLLLLSVLVQASTLSSSALVRGLLHPLTGPDHLLAMISVGLWGSQKGGRAATLWPVVFLVAMVGGGVLGMSGFALPMVEPMIAASVLVLGLAIASARALPLPGGTALVVLFALFHGNAHGLEAPMLGQEGLYVAGFAASTLALLGLGLALGLASRSERGMFALRSGGVVSAACGAALFFL